MDTGWALSGGEDEYSQQRDEFIVRALAAMRYDALNAGAGELRAGDAALERLAELGAPALVSSNAPVASAGGGLIVEVGGVQVGLVGVTSADPNAPAPSDSAGDPIDLTPASEALWSRLPAIRSEADVIVALADLEPTEVQELAETGLDVDVLLGRRSLQCQALTWVGRTVCVAAGGDGRYVGKLTLEVDAQGQIVSASNRYEVLNRDTPDDPGIVALMAEYE